MSIRQRKIVSNYLKVDEEFELLGTGFTELSESFSPQTTSKRYINSSASTQSVTGYEWSTPFTADQIVSNEAIDFIKNIGEMQLTGSETETEYIIVDLDRPATIVGDFHARKFNVAISVDSTEDNDGELGLSGNFLGQSEPIEGTFTVSTKEFATGFTPAV